VTRSKPILFTFAFAGALLGACAHSPPAELVDARAAYEQAATGPSQKYNPAELHVARESLIRAEALFDEKGDTSVVRDQAYIARRKAELADTLARTEALRREAAAATQQARLAKDREATRTRAELKATQEVLATQQAVGAATQDELAVERQRREEAEQRAAKVAADLARLASVKQDERGMVITLSGSVVFASGKHTLLPAARNRLSQVADALLRSEPDATFVVEGHTDSTGSAALNQTLSQQRADTVRDYLVERGVPEARITAEGHGADRPVAGNDSSEGRANNRRVEIIVKPRRET